MTSNQDTAPTQPQKPSPKPRRLLRSRDDRVLAGVAGGLGTYFDVDPIMFRIGFAVLTVVGGIGALAYAAAWLFVPEDDGTGNPAAPGRSRAATIAGAVALAIAAVILLGGAAGPFWGIVPDEPGGLAALAVLASIALIAAALYTGWTQRGPRQQRRPLTFGRVALFALAAVAAFALAVLAALGAAWATAEGAGVVVAGVIVALGVAMVGLSFMGSAAWLAVPAIVLAVPVGVVSASGLHLSGGYGDRRETPLTVADLPADGYRMAGGCLLVDLRDLRLPSEGTVPVRLKLGVGSAAVLVPYGVPVDAKAHAGMGHIEMLGRQGDGIDVDRHLRAPAAAASRVKLDVSVDVGEARIDTSVTDAGRRDDERCGER